MSFYTDFIKDTFGIGNWKVLGISFLGGIMCYGTFWSWKLWSDPAISGFFLLLALIMFISSHDILYSLMKRQARRLEERT